MKPPVAWRQAGLITAGAIALLAAFHFVPAGPDLSHLDFVPGGPDALQFCDPENPRFLPVVAKSSPVTMTLAPASPPVAGDPVRVTLTLRTVTGKPIRPADLLPTATKKILLLLIDPELGDFQTVVPIAAAVPGEWSFALVPRRAGIYRIFADLTPAATRREMYVSADLAVGAAGGEDQTGVPTPGTDNGYHFELRPSGRPIYARQPVDLRLSVSGDGGGMVPLVPDLGAFAHLTAFDRARTGLVNVHGPISGGTAPDPFRPAFIFHVTFPDPGRYVVWSQVSLNGRVVRKSFPIAVLP